MSARPSTAPSGLAVGVTTAAAILLIVGGICHTMEGFVGIATHEFYVVGQKWIFQFEVTTWGWIHVVVGALAVIAGIGLFFGAIWARTLAIVIAAISIVANFLWLPDYPVWAVLIIAFDTFVIWALTAHGGDVAAVDR
jgi:hypothetical protein